MNNQNGILHGNALTDSILSDSPATSTADLHRFILQNGRLPFIGDERKPWEYSGWLLYYCQLAHYHPSVCNRWDYYMRTLEAGRLLDEPIPPIEFVHIDENAPALKMLRQSLDIVFHDLGSWSAFPALLDWLSWGMSVSAEAPRLSAATNEALYRHFNLEPLLITPADYLGHLYAEGQGKWNHTAFYPTPHTVVDLIVRMTMSDAQNADGPDPRLLTVMDPCIGSGRFPLHASNYSLCLYGMDIDRICVQMSKINGCLFAPWLTFPLPAQILGRPVPPPPPAPLDPFIPEERRTSAEQPSYRVDDRGQGLLFGD